MSFKLNVSCEYIRPVLRFWETESESRKVKVGKNAEQTWLKTCGLPVHIFNSVLIAF